MREKERKISALLYRNTFRHAVIAHPDKHEVGDFVKPTERKRVRITNKKSYDDERSHVLITFPESLNLLPRPGEDAWRSVKLPLLSVLDNTREKDVQFTSQCFFF